MRAGKIIPHDVKPASHELDTILFFTNLGKNVELISPSHTPKTKSPGFYMDGLTWEAKSPLVGNNRTLERLFYHASQQSCNVVIDLRRIKAKNKEQNFVRLLEKYL